MTGECPSFLVKLKPLKVLPKKQMDKWQTWLWFASDLVLSLSGLNGPQTTSPRRESGLSIDFPAG